MINIAINENHRKLADIFAPQLNKGGHSNVPKKFSKSSSRLEQQYIGLYGEMAWFLYRDGDLDRFKNIMEAKIEIGKGDNGIDDTITKNNYTRKVDIKATYSISLDDFNDRIKNENINLLVPEREYRKDTIYVSACSIGKDKRNIENVIIYGWTINEKLNNKWKYSKDIYCVKPNDLFGAEKLKEIL